MNVMTRDVVLAAMKAGDFAKQESDLPAKFKVGDVIRTKSFSPEGHTRLTTYVKDKVGVVKIAHGVYPLPDAPERGEHVYSVEFRASDLWDEANPVDTLRIDLWDSYMEAEEDL